MGRLDGKVAIVTGSARGTGEITARLFAAEGAKVVIADILDDRGKAVAAELGEAAMYVHLDITQEEDWSRAVEETTRTFGPPSVLVNNAAISHSAPMAETSAEDLDRVYRVNVRGAFLGMKAVMEPMKSAGGGSIVNISSVSGMEGTANCIAYSASKWAVRGISRTAAMELGVFGIRVNTVCPGPGSQEMGQAFHPGFPDRESYKEARAERAGLARLAPRPGTGQETVAHTILFLASDESYYCHGADYPVDGGKFAGNLPLQYIAGPEALDQSVPQAQSVGRAAGAERRLSVRGE